MSTLCDLLVQRNHFSFLHQPFNPFCFCQMLSHCRHQVVDIMRVNVDKVLERDQKLSELDDRADALQAGASQFESCAAKLKNKYWWKNCKVGAFRCLITEKLLMSESSKCLQAFSVLFRGRHYNLLMSCCCGRQYSGKNGRKTSATKEFYCKLDRLHK